MNGFLDALDDRVLVCDGAMGTMLYAKGVFVNRCFDELNLTRAELVAEVHREYVAAGADVIETNTFGANRVKLANFGLTDQVAAINREGAAIAKRAAAGRAWVAGSIGPLGVRIEPWGRTSVEEAEAAFREQARALVEGGVDLFMLETFRDLNEVAAAVRAVRAVSALPIVAQVTTGRRREHARRRGAGDLHAGARTLGRGRDRRELLGRPGRHARDDRGDGAAHDARGWPRSRTPDVRATSTAGTCT